MTRDDELTEFFRSVLPEQEPRVPSGVTERARHSGLRWRRRRRIRAALGGTAVVAVLGSVGLGVGLLDRGAGSAPAAAGRPAYESRATDFAALIDAVRQNILFEAAGRRSAKGQPQQPVPHMMVSDAEFVSEKGTRTARVTLVVDGRAVRDFDISIGIPRAAWLTCGRPLPSASELCASYNARQLYGIPARGVLDARKVEGRLRAELMLGSLNGPFLLISTTARHTAVPSPGVALDDPYQNAEQVLTLIEGEASFKVTALLPQ